MTMLPNWVNQRHWRYLYRGKQLNTDEWITGCLLIENNGHAQLEPDHCYIVPLNTNSKYDDYRVDPHTVGQCTGLLDRSDKLIFEGDIVKGIALQREGGFEYCGEIVWYDYSTSIGWHIKDNVGSWELKQAQARISLNNITGEIIGNVYDNPKLM